MKLKFRMVNCLIKDKQAIFTIHYTFHTCGYYVVIVATIVAN